MDKSLFQFYIDGLFILTLLTAILSQRLQSILMAILCSLLFTWTGICGHNFFHQRDNYRMKYFNLLFVSYRDWRVSHAFSHHLYPNSLLDMELSAGEPFVVWLPSATAKNQFQRYASYIYSPLLYCLFYPVQFGKKSVQNSSPLSQLESQITSKKILFSSTVSTCLSLFRLFFVATQGHDMYFDELLPFVVPITMYSFGGDHSLLSALKLFLIVILSGGFIFGVIGWNAGHHHPEIVHDGDAVR